MGTERGFEDERPPHPVFVDKFELGVCPVTRAEYKCFVDATQHELPLDWSHPQFAQPDLPVVGVSWIDAVAYCAWRFEQDGRPVRLPTEAEWEFAARGGVDGALFVWGDTVDGIRSPEAANVADDTVRPHYPWWAVFPNYRDGFSWTAPAGSFAANGFGLFDMAGNVWEWTADWYAPTAYSSSPAMDPRGPASGRSRVVRGSSWGDEPLVLRISERSYQTPEHRSYFHGFRCARDQPAN